MFGGFLISTYKLRFLEAFKASFSTMWKGGGNLTNERINEYQDLSQVKDQQQLLLQVGRDSDSIEEQLLSNTLLMREGQGEEKDEEGE